MKLGEHDGDEGPQGEPDPVIEAIERAPVAPAGEEEIDLLEDVEEGPATWKQILPGGRQCPNDDPSGEPAAVVTQGPRRIALDVSPPGPNKIRGGDHECAEENRCNSVCLHSSNGLRVPRERRGRYGRRKRQLRAPAVL